MATVRPTPNHTFASDNTAGICPEALAALNAANAGASASYGDDPWTANAREQFNAIFQTECAVYFVFNGTAANALTLAACCRDPYSRILCHSIAHIDTDECGAPEFFSGGTKLVPLPGAEGKLWPDQLERAMHVGHGIHYPKPGALSLTQATEWGTVYTAAELQALASVARAHRVPVHLDGARFANAVASLAVGIESEGARRSLPADLTWRAGIDVLCLGGTKNGMLSTDAIVFFNRDLAQQFEYRVKQGGQLASKMRFAAAQWTAMLRGGAWLQHAAHANSLARSLADGLRALPGLKLALEPEVNGVFVEMSPSVYAALNERGWFFHRFIGEDGYRLMCSWSTTQDDVSAFVHDAREVVERSNDTTKKPRV